MEGVVGFEDVILADGEISGECSQDRYFFGLGLSFAICLDIETVGIEFAVELCI